MKLRWMVVALVMPAWLCPPLAQAEPATSVQVEISFLLGYIEGSGCEFYRNGTWSNSLTAQAHIRDKYKYLMARSLIDSTEQFIERAASKSSLSGQAYQVRCSGRPTVTSEQWLRDEPARLRTY